MFKRLKDEFKKASKPAKAIAVSLVIWASPVSGAQAAQVHAPIFKEASYWQYTDKQVTLEIVECQKKGLCITIKDLDPNDPKVKDFYNRLNSSDKKPTEISQPDLYDFLCDYKFNTKLSKKNDSLWLGKIFADISGKGYNGSFSVEEQLNGNLTLKFSPVFFITVKRELKPSNRPSNGNFCSNKKKP